MSKHKLNSAESYESIEVKINAKDHPVAFRTKIEELIDSGMQEHEAIEYLNEFTFELEIYYEPDAGLMAVEAEFIDHDIIYSPYTGYKYVK